MAESFQIFHIDQRDDGVRLDAFLAAELRLSRQQVKRLLADKLVTVNERTHLERDKGVLLAAGDAVAVRAFSRPEQMCVTPDASTAIEVLAEGPGYVVVDKPAGMPVHPLKEGETGTVLNGVLGLGYGVQGVGEGGLRSGVVHRLDNDTTGTVIFATEQDTWTRLREAFTQHHASKTYRAIVAGRLTGDGKEIVNLIVARRRPAFVKVIETNERGSRRCDLAWRAVEELTGATLVQVQLGTGFLHQIRVMMAHMGHPVLGDKTYGPETLKHWPHLKRPMLHASDLAIDDINAHAPDPHDFATCLNELRVQG